MKGLDVQSAWSRVRALVTVAGLALPACASPNTNHYVIASTGTVIGVEVAQNPANQSPHAKLGYNRSELALVPTSRPPCAIKSDDSSVICGEIKGAVKDVPDVLMELRYGGIFDLGASSGIYQRLAVGQTAVSRPGAAFLFAKDSDGNLNPQAAQALAIPRHNALAREIVGDAAQAGNLEELRVLAAKDYDQLSESSSSGSARSPVPSALTAPDCMMRSDRNLEDNRMQQFTTKFVLVQIPVDDAEADALSAVVTREHGTNGFQLASAVRVNDRALLLCLVREES